MFVKQRELSTESFFCNVRHFKPIIFFSDYLCPERGFGDMAYCFFHKCNSCRLFSSKEIDSLPLADWLYRQDKSSRSQNLPVFMFEVLSSFENSLPFVQQKNTHTPLFVTFFIIFFLNCYILIEVHEAKTNVCTFGYT